MDSFLMFKHKAVLASIDSILLVKEVIEVHPEHREFIFKKISDNLEDINSPVVIRVATWILVEYSKTQEEIDNVFLQIKKNIGSLPLKKD